mgnify:CR=1 FL=1
MFASSCLSSTTTLSSRCLSFLSRSKQHSMATSPDLREPTAGSRVRFSDLLGLGSKYIRPGLAMMVRTHRTRRIYFRRRRDKHTLSDVRPALLSPHSSVPCRPEDNPNVFFSPAAARIAFAARFYPPSCAGHPGTAFLLLTRVGRERIGARQTECSMLLLSFLSRPPRSRLPAPDATRSGADRCTANRVLCLASCL